MHKVLMPNVLRIFVTGFAIVALAYLGGAVSAQAPVKQIKLSEKQIESFISAHKEMVEAFDKMAAETSEDAVKQKLDTIAKKFGFKDHTEYEQVVTNIDLVMYGLDPKTKTFTDPPTLVKNDLEAAKADKSLSDKERQQLVEELNEQLKVAQPIEHASNVELVKKYYDKIEPLLQ